MKKTALQLLAQRDLARKEKDFKKADSIRREIEVMGYQIVDGVKGVELLRIKELKNQGIKELKKGLVAVFGSGEMSPTGRRIHEYLISDKKPPVKIALLETPAGFEENPRSWYGKLAEMLEVGLAPYQPQIFFVEALTRKGTKSTNDKEILRTLLSAHYIHTGAGSPTYAVKHLKNSLAFKYLYQQNQKGLSLSFASAAAIAIGRFCLPVYEIYKAGANLHWEDGLDFFKRFDLNLTIIPHWNNQEGGAEIDTSCCYMGQKRFNELRKILPGATTILGIDEQTAAVFDPNKKEVLIMGNGEVVVIKGQKADHFSSGENFSFTLLN
ncbi:cysteinyl-tRNA synthetase [Candidatus Gottesmanbacteria bacterium]|nr:cysteinyl-tRNA synthetase [Candidatus Gottesmanbacteria bacterium]